MPRRITALGGMLCLGLASCQWADRCAALPVTAPVPTTATVVASKPVSIFDATPVVAESKIREVGFDAPAAPPVATPLPATDPQPLSAPQPLVLEGESAVLGLTLADVEAMALANNPSLQVAAFGVGGRQGVRTQVGLGPNPVIGYTGQDIGDNGTAGQQGMFVSQTIVRGRKLALNRAVARWDTEEANWIAETQRYRVLNDVRTAFNEALGAQRRIAIAEELVAVAEKGVETSRALVQAEQAAKPDVLQAEVQLSEVGIVLQNAEIEYEAAWIRLISLAGQPYLAPTPLVGELRDELPEVEWDVAYDTLVSLSPELQRAEARIQRSRVLIARQCVQPIPNLQTQFGVTNDFATDTVLTSVQLGMAIPVRNRNQGNVRATIAEQHRAECDAERIRLALRERLAVTVRDFSQARQQAERYRTEIVPKSRESYELIEAGYEQGEFDFLRVLTARRIYFEAQLARVRSLIALNRAHVALEGLLLTGGLDAVPEANTASGLRGQALSGQ